MEWLWKVSVSFLISCLQFFFFPITFPEHTWKLLHVLLPCSWASLFPDPWVKWFPPVNYPICYFAIVVESRLKQFKITLCAYSAAWNRAMQTTAFVPKLHSIISSHSLRTIPTKKYIYLAGFILLFLCLFCIFKQSILFIYIDFLRIPYNVFWSYSGSSHQILLAPLSFPYPYNFVSFF